MCRELACSESDLLRHLFEMVLARCIEEGFIPVAKASRSVPA
jgi:hypothetical protein